MKKIIKAEEESFNVTLDRGIELFEEIVIRLEKTSTKEIPGKDVFKLYDTFGFPADLTNIMAQEMEFTIDEKGFNELMDKQKARARDASKDKFASVNISLSDLSSFELFDDKATEFTGYDELKSDAKVIGHKKEKETDLIILDRSPFYVEAGGQIDDIGKIELDENKFDVIDVTKVDDKTIHILQDVTEGLISNGKKVIAEIDRARRWDIMRNHTATHFLHAALRKVLGNHVHQAGSYVGPDHLRFDFTHFAKPASEEIRDIEALVNDELRRNYSLQHHRNIPFDEAKKMGALMFSR